uniref:CCHC-type domain-containing protein n=1 Tax=Nicotiana tabacum TaxID=4097 RepID=A0A1S3ZUB5_TOBAC|nr:PREDICTED: uncharacterized protein LOC107790539 [Nicotiana tabacum]
MAIISEVLPHFSASKICLLSHPSSTLLYCFPKQKKNDNKYGTKNGSIETTIATMATMSSSCTPPASPMAPRFIGKDVPILGKETPENERFVVIEAWKHSDFLCKNYILSCLEDGLYNVYSVMKISRELWNALEKKYKTEDARLKKFVATKFLNFKMVDDKSVITQVQELQLPPLWKDFKNYLKHKHKEMTLEDLIVRLWIEEDNKATKKKSHGNSIIMGANIVEEASTSNRKRKKSSGLKNYPSKKKFKGNCYNCEKVRHKVVDCRAPKKDKKKSQTNMVEKNDEMED